ncbi:hypothetical protein G7084_04515 [Weissella coleopterorum]|uniref:Uncharacterized protein n=1 Tax=Weissella coleopterorum TaxID=2714949 RepID=A0A6G8AY10_9LACO|nr:hypothetical protein [Weissella coleopterorum]QIL49842.1 hypothetical protein G7084_04515 [Weissella coleopterorum]
MRRKGHITVYILMFSIFGMTVLQHYLKIEKRQYEVIIEQNKHLEREIKKYKKLINRTNENESLLAKKS